MKKTSKKSNTPKKAKQTANASARVRKTATRKKAVASSSNPQAPLINKQPQSKQKAAASAGMFLYTDDAWSLRYFDDKDLHCIERELFG